MECQKVSEQIMEAQEREMGQQPLQEVMEQLQLSNHDLVAASAEQLTHKVVAKGRKGRWLTEATRQKITRALNKAAKQQFNAKDLFNYE